MRKTILILFFGCFSAIAFAQEKTKRLPFVLLIDNEVPDPSIIKGIFLIKDSIGMIKDSIKFDYQIGGLDLESSAYNKFFKVNQTYNIFVRFKEKDFKLNTTYIYQEQIPNKYINDEYPNGFINERYFIVKIFNKFNGDSRAKYYFKKNENYIVQIEIPGFSSLLPTLKKSDK